MSSLVVNPIGIVRSDLVVPRQAPKQGHEGAPPASIEIRPEYEPALTGLEEESEILVLTWLHLADRSLLQVHP